MLVQALQEVCRLSCSIIFHTITPDVISNDDHIFYSSVYACALVRVVGVMRRWPYSFLVLPFLLSCMKNVIQFHKTIYPVFIPYYAMYGMSFLSLRSVEMKHSLLELNWKDFVPT